MKRYGDRMPGSHSDVGRNFGRHARPYGESYGEQTPYPGEYDDPVRQKHTTRQGRGDAGYRPGEERDWWERAGDEVLSWFGDDYAERRRRRDARHRGKGPRNYKRSDERIREDINDHLTEEWNIDASDIEVTVADGEVILTGYVMDRYQKRRAEDLAEGVSGVTNVENRIRIHTPMTQMR